MVVYDIETFKTDRVVPYANCIYRLSKISGKDNRDITEQESEKLEKVRIVFRGLDNRNELLDYVLHIKGEQKNQKKVKYNLHLLAHKGSSFDSYVVLNNLPQWRTVVSLIRNGSGIVSSKIFNGYVDPVVKIPQCSFLMCIVTF